MPSNLAIKALGRFLGRRLAVLAVLLIMYFGAVDLVAAPSADQHSRQNALSWTRAGVDCHRPSVAVTAGNQYAFGVRGHALSLQLEPGGPKLNSAWWRCAKSGY